MSVNLIKRTMLVSPLASPTEEAQTLLMKEATILGFVDVVFLQSLLCEKINKMEFVEAMSVNTREPILAVSALTPFLTDVTLELAVDFDVPLEFLHAHTAFFVRVLKGFHGLVT